MNIATSIGMKFDYRGVVRFVTAVVAFAMVVYHMWAIGFGTPEAVYFRGIHLLFAIVLTFLINLKAQQHYRILVEFTYIYT